MPRDKDAAASRSQLRVLAGIPLSAVFIGCTLIPALPAFADGPTLSLSLGSQSVEPGASFSLPLEITNTLDDSVVAITDVDVVSTSPGAEALGVSPLPETLEAQARAAADVTGTAAQTSVGSKLQVKVKIFYTYEVPDACPEPPAQPSPSLAQSALRRAMVPQDVPSPEAPEGTADTCWQTREGTAQVKAAVTVTKPAPPPPTETTPPSATSPSDDPTSGGPTTPPPTTRPPTTPPPGGVTLPPSERTTAPRVPAHAQTPDRSSPVRPPRSPHSPTAPASRRSAPPHHSAPTENTPFEPRPDLPTDLAELPSLPIPSADEYAELPLVTPGEEDGAATTVAQEADAVPSSITPLILAMFLVLLLLFSAPLAPVRRVRVSSVYIGRRRRH